MSVHFRSECLYFNSDNHLVTWNEMKIGTIYYHIHCHYYAIKTGNHTYFDITDKHNSRRSKLLQDGGDYKNFIECSYRIQNNGGDLSGK